MESNLANRTPQSFLKTISIIHFALASAPMLFAMIAFWEIRITSIDLKNTDDPFMVVVPVIAIVGIIASSLVFRQQIDDIGRLPLKEKLTIYQTALVVKYASLEGAALICVASYLIKGNLLFLIIGGLIILDFFYVRPTKRRVENDLELSDEDKLEFFKGD